MNNARTNTFQVLASALALMWCQHSFAASAAEVAESIGLSPASLLACDVSQSDATTMLQGIETETVLVADMDAKEAVIVNAAAALADAQAALSADPGNQQLATAVTAAEQAVDDAESAFITARCLLYDTVLGHVGPQVLVDLESWRIAAVHDVPDAFRVVSQTDDEWREVSRALRIEARSLRRGLAVDAAVTAMLDAIRDDAAVVAAGQRLSSSLTVMNALFEQFDD
ncbi:MAG: hypothetical protein AAF432_03255 [Planctomycetota bacterium]